MATVNMVEVGAEGQVSNDVVLNTKFYKWLQEEQKIATHHKVMRKFPLILMSEILFLL